MAAAEKVRITKTLIDKTMAPGIVWDSVTPGLGLRVYPRGQRERPRKAFLIDYRFRGQRRRIVLGQYGAITLEQARGLARKKLGQVADGVDPKQARLRRRPVKDLAAEYRTHHVPLKKTGDEDTRRLRRWIEPAWGPLPFAQVTRHEVLQLHRRVGTQSGPYEANRVLALVSRLWSLAQQWGYVDEMAPNPTKHIEKYPEKKRRRYVTAAEMPALAASINGYEDPFVRTAIWLYLLTGMRKSELLARRWSEVDFTVRVLRVPDTKGGEPAEIPLSTVAARLLEELPRVAGCPFLFPGQDLKTYRRSFRRSWGTILARAGIEDLRLHDLRRTLGSWLAQRGTSLRVIGEVLRHQDLETTQGAYAHLSQEVVRDTLEDHSALLLPHVDPRPVQTWRVTVPPQVVEVKARDKLEAEQLARGMVEVVALDEEKARK